MSVRFNAVAAGMEAQSMLPRHLSAGAAAKHSTIHGRREGAQCCHNGIAFMRFTHGDAVTDIEIFCSTGIKELVINARWLVEKSIA